MRNPAAATAASLAVVTSLQKRAPRGPKGRKAGVRNILRGTSTWKTDYLGSSPAYPLRLFRQRFRIARSMFYKLLSDLTASYPNIWNQRSNAAGRRCIIPEIKILACLRVLGTARSFDDLDDGSRMSKDSLRMYFRNFCRCIKHLYGESVYNRLPTKSELVEIANRYAENGFKGCIGCVDGYKSDGRTAQGP